MEAPGWDYYYLFKPEEGQRCVCHGQKTGFLLGVDRDGHPVGKDPCQPGCLDPIGQSERSGVLTMARI